MSNTSAVAVASHVTDMLVLEQHLESALVTQIEEVSAASVTARELGKLHQTCKRHVAALEALIRRHQSHATRLVKTVKEAATSLLGVSAIGVEFIRSEKLPQNVPEDYAAVSLLCVGYVMLHRSGLFIADAEIAEVAYRHLQDHARSTMALRMISPPRGPQLRPRPSRA